jgi:predicted dehydrogenase
MNIGVLCPSEIALRRFMPALSKTDFSFVGLAINSPEERYGGKFPSNEKITAMLHSETTKAKKFVDSYGGYIFPSYEDIISSSDIEAIYIPLPPGLHFMWAKKALEKGKNVLVEKPSTTSLKDTQELISIASKNKLALHENYMFNFHSQLDEIDQIIKNGEIGEVRLYSIKFGFPLRTANDFRYVKALGGGALIDAGGYCIKYAIRLLGESTHLVCAKMNNKDGYEVDMYGSATLENDDGLTAQIAFGMDNDYRCELEVWGSKGTLRTGRVLTAPAGYEPIITISKNGILEDRKLKPDDAFEKSILRFKKCIENEDIRKKNYREIEIQATLLQDFLNK